MEIFFKISLITFLLILLPIDVYAENEFSNLNIKEDIQQQSMNWYDDIVEKLVSEKIIENTQNLEAPLLRGEMAQILSKTGLFNRTSFTINPFVDLNLKDQYYTAVCNLYWNGIYAGELDSEDNLYSNCMKILTREQAASFVVRAFGLTGAGSSEVYFEDSNDISNYAKESVDICYALGVVSGYNDKTFKPNGQITKAEFLVMLYNIINLPDNCLNLNSVIKSTFEDRYRSSNVLCETDRDTYKFEDDIIINFLNLADFDYYFSEEFQLEFWLDGEWLVVPCDKGGVSDVAFSINNRSNIKVTLTDYFNNLPISGKYRIVMLITPSHIDKQIDFDVYNKEYISAEFFIY